MRKIAFRVDASLQIGSGHLMRCLTLAEALRDKDAAQCHFIARAHPGHLLEQIWDRGFELHSLPPGSSGFVPDASDGQALPAHAAWLGCDWQTDAGQTALILESLHPDWLVVDHYALDARWHAMLAPYYRRLFAIDDLADRPLLCDLLLDQTYARSPADYQPWLPTACQVLCGSEFALLRPQFNALREQSLARRTAPQLRQLLVTMGGVDKNNVTGQVLDAIRQSKLALGCQVTVVMGITAPWLAEVQAQAATLPWPCRVLVNVGNMARLMADSDLCIGAAGSTAWERCTLGVPSVMAVTADNQNSIAQALDASGAAISLGSSESPQFAARLQAAIGHFADNAEALRLASIAAAAITDGKGTDIVSDKLLEAARS